MLNDRHIDDRGICPGDLCDDTSERFEQMNAEMESCYGDHQLSDEEADGVYIQYVYNMVKCGSFNYSMNDWLQVHDQIASVGRIRNGNPSTFVLNSAELDFETTMDLLGYDESSRLSPMEWVDRQGVAAGRREGRDWDAALRGDYSVKANTFPINDIADIPFNEMVAYRAAHNEPWTARDTAMLNDKIRQGWDRIQDVVQSWQEDNEELLIDAQCAESLREETGVQGDESDIPYYEAKQRMYGRSYESIMAEYNERCKDLEIYYQGACESFFKEVYITDKTRMDALPDNVRNGFGKGYGNNDSLITKNTVNYLNQCGSKYTLYCNKQRIGYIDDKRHDLQTLMAPHNFRINYALHGTDGPIVAEPQSDRVKQFSEGQKRVVLDSLNTKNRILNSVENGVSNPDYDFDDYDF